MPQQSPISFPMGTKNVLIIDGNDAMQKVRAHDDEENVRARAYELYEVRGRIDGHAEEDWLQAEGEVAGSNERNAVRASTSKITVKIVGEA